MFIWILWVYFGSVPTLMDLLSHPDNRPVVFDLYKSGEKERYDQEKFGLLINRDKASKAYKKLLKKAKKGQRSIYYIDRMGHSNQGHYFKFYKNLKLEDKKDIIEYLKTL